MSEAARIQELYTVIEALPQGVTGNLIRGQLHAQTRAAAAPPGLYCGVEG